jgi:PAS domain S-box-containing protein
MQALKPVAAAESRAEETSPATFAASHRQAAEADRRRVPEKPLGMLGMIDAWRRRPCSIQARLVWIVLILAAPALVGLLAIALGLYQHERDQISQSALTTVHALVSALDRDLAGTTAAAQVLAESPFLASHDFAEFRREAKSVLPLLGGSAVVLAEADGQQIINTRVPYGMPLPARSERVNHNKVFETGLASVSDIIIGAVAKKPVFDIDVPVFRDGRVVYSLGVAVEPSRLNDLLQNQRLPAGWVATITDSSGLIIARTHDPELVGQRVPVRLSAMTPSQPGLVEAKRVDGTSIIVGFSKSDVSNWTVAIGIPTTQLHRKSNSVLLYGAASVFCALIIGLVTATYQSRRIARAVQGLIPSALAVGHGEAPNAPQSGVRETDDVARALVLAHELLQVRTQQRDSAEMTVAARSLADEMFRLAVESCPNGMMMYDARGKILMVNGEIEKQFGYVRSELIGQPVAILVPERYRLQHARNLQQFMLKPETLRMDAALERLGRRKDGTEFPTEVGLNPIHAGEELMVLCVCVDLTERKRTERLKDEFVATVSHELRTPLTSIAGALGLLIGQWTKDLPESAARLLTIAHANSLRLGRLINDILDIEKIESGHVVFNLKRVQVRPLVTQVVEDIRGYADKYGVRVEFDAESSDADANADPDRLSQAVANLLSNAIKFSPIGDDVCVAVENHGDNLRITVRDHGPGIPDHFKPHVFEKFAQADATDSRQRGGTGLGLSIVKEIVERLGGKLGFLDAPGGGAIFHIDLPVWDDSIGGQSRATQPGILLCEKDPAVRTAVRMRLSSAGLTVDFAHTVQDAILRCGTNRYAAVVIGLPLGEGDAFDTVAEIRKIPHHGSTLVLVASDASETRNAGVSPRDAKHLKWVKLPIDVECLTSELVAAIPARSRSRPRILHVDDDRDVLADVAHELNTIADVVSADSVEMARQELTTSRIDLVIVDIELGSGLELLADIRDGSGNVIPVVVFSNANPELPGDGEMRSSAPMAISPLRFLRSAVLDRLGLSSAPPEKEVA